MHLPLALLLRRELPPVEAADGILGVAAEGHPARVVLVAVQGKFEQVGTFVVAGQLALEFPLFEVIGRVNRQVVAVRAVIEGHHPMPARRIPEDIRIAAVVADDRVVLPVSPGQPRIVAVGDGLAAARIGEGRDHHLFAPRLKTRCVVGVDRGAAGKTMVLGHRPGVEGDGQLLPMHEVFAHRMAPVHIAPTPAIRIVLEEQMPLAVVIDHAIGIIGPAAFGAEVELRAELFLVKRIALLDLVALVDRLQAMRTAGELIDGDGGRLALPGAGIDEGPEIGRPIGQLDIEDANLAAIHGNAHAAHLAAVFHGQIEIPLFDDDLPRCGRYRTRGTGLA